MANGMQWQFADIYETIATAIPDRAAFIYGDQTVTWRSFDQPKG